ncbi:MAG: hypothetical protein IJT20_02335 [Synergistaceae bacterium]|nr:hypothetical protein [Synergistaceae bacterium]
MERKIFESFVGKQVEVFLVPDTPQTSGVVLSCEDDYLVIGEELWAYPAVLGIRPLKKSSRNSYINPPVVQRAEAVTYSDEINSEAEKKAFLPKKEKPAEHVKHKKQEEIKEEKAEEPDISKEVKEVPEVPEVKEMTAAEDKTEKQNVSESADAQNVLNVQEEAEPSEQKAEEKPQAEETEKENKTEIDLSGREFEGTIVAFYYERGYWGFIESKEIKDLGIPLRDGERVFVHINQISDEILRNKLKHDKKRWPMIDVVFKLGKNKHGAVADDVREKANINLPKLPENVLKVDMLSAVYEEGEIDYFRRYDGIPHGEIRVKGNVLYRFEESDVVDPVLAVFLECSPSAEGQKVRFVKVMGKRGKMQATQVSAAEPFPEEKLRDWEKSGLIQKAKERMGIKE